MAKVKISKKRTSVDMTAMCDVAFLLLSFFIMTAQARQPEPFPVDAPASTVQTKLPDSNLATITIGDSTVFFGVTGQDVRIMMLEKMGEKYNVTFTEDEKKTFSLIEYFGVDIKQMHSLIAMSASDRARPGIQPGIPLDSANNQLYDWVLNARFASRTLDAKKENPTKRDLDVAIKGGKNIDYPMVKKVIDILQRQKKNNFYLVTGLRNEDF
ncbi:MAG: biopolymer transporter ExbD [Rikenellaceae bacterium]|jgi:biopolymer transport protein ExbD|nr:biopolymer transporter ExbD [Rikenellaceae bacterium]